MSRLTPTLSAFATGRAVAPLWVAPNGRAFYPIAGGAPDDDGGDGGSGDGGDGGGSDDGAGDEGKGGDAGQSYTKADLERIINDRLGEATRKHQRELEQARQDATATETEKIELERDRAKDRATNAVAKAAPRVASALAQVAAIAAGGRPDRAAAIVRQADLDDVAAFDGDDWTVDDEKVKAAVGKVLDEYPEWKTDAGTSEDKGGDKGKREDSKSGGDLGGGTGGGDVTLEQFKGMSMGARSELRQNDPEAYRKLADAEIAEGARR